MPAPILIGPAPGASWLARGASVLRGWFSRRALLRLAGVPVVVLDGRVYGVRPVPLGVARDMVPALVRCSRRFAAPQPPLAVSDPAAHREQRLAEMRKEAADLAARFQGWTFVLPNYKFANMNKTLDELLKPLEPK